MLCTWHIVNQRQVCEGTSWRRGRSGEANYNQQLYGAHMGAVDRTDHYCASYSFTPKTLRWWRKNLATEGVSGTFFHPVQERNRSTKTQALGIQEKPHPATCWKNQKQLCKK